MSLYSSHHYRWLGHFIHIRKDDEVPIVLGPFKIVKVTNVFRKCVAKIKSNEASVLIIIATSNAVICKPKSEKRRKKMSQRGKQEQIRREWHRNKFGWLSGVCLSSQGESNIAFVENDTLVLSLDILIFVYLRWIIYLVTAQSYRKMFPATPHPNKTNLNKPQLSNNQFSAGWAVLWHGQWEPKKSYASR